MPKISVIVPVYNVEKYIRLCIDSIINQTLEEWECLLIDDGSPDNSGAICDEYAEKDTRFRVFHVANGGVSRARNIGLENMIGEWVIFVDSDDAIATNTLEVCFKLATKNNLDLLQFSLCRDRQLLNNHDCRHTGILNLLQYVHTKQFNVCVAGSFYNVGIISNNALYYDERLKLAEDQIFNYKYMNCCSKIMRIDECLYWYRITEGSATSNQKTKDIEVSINAVNSFKYLYPIWSSPIDCTLIVFLCDLIINNDKPLIEIKRLWNECNINNTSMMRLSYKIILLLYHLNPNFAFRYVQFKYGKYNK